MNLPNKLSMLRICMIPIFVIFALMDAAWAQYDAGMAEYRAQKAKLDEQVDAAADALRFQKIRGFITQRFQLRKGEGFFVAVHIAPNQRFLDVV